MKACSGTTPPFDELPNAWPFAEHVHGFIARQGMPSTPKRTKVLAGFHPPLDGPVVLFHEVIEATPDSMPAGFVQNPVAFELCDRRRVSAVAVGVDHAGRGVVLPAQGLGQEAFGGFRVLRGREEKIGSVATFGETVKVYAITECFRPELRTSTQ